MLQARCITEYRDKNNKIIGYRLQLSNSKIVEFTSGELKDLIRGGKIEVSNLKLTSNNRLILDRDNDAYAGNIDIEMLSKSLVFLNQEVEYVSYQLHSNFGYYTSAGDIKVELQMNLGATLIKYADYYVKFADVLTQAALVKYAAKFNPVVHNLDYVLWCLIRLTKMDKVKFDQYAKLSVLISSIKDQNFNRQ